MRKNLICCFLLLCSFFNGRAQEQIAVQKDTLQQDSVQEKRIKFAIYPALGYSPETKVNIGTIAFFVFNTKSKNPTFHRPSSITPYIVFTTNKQVLIKSDFDLFFGNGMNLNMEARVFDFPDNYYGIGSETDPAIVERYTDKYVAMSGTLLKPVTPQWFGGIRFDFQYNNITDLLDSGLLETDVPVGIEGGRNMGLGPAFRNDTRNSTLWPTHGRFINARAAFYGKAFGGEYNYGSFLFDYRQYFEFLGPKSVLAFQFRMNLTSGDAPFYKLPKMGGGGRLRGIEHRNLYRDRQLMYFQVEARQELFWRFGGVVFAGVGEVFDSFSEFGTDKIRAVYGLGGRFRALKDEKLNFRMDLGFTDNGQHAFYLSVREAF
ncbi:MAG: BamA/TamA family outer membrane protein [Reichenbachiella sp.]|uniref:BamA/TamA family outer membrane protein n=1 Tax=Reichenbachiella sp. TaxID=2184521 RepID=UPI003296B465